MTLQGAARPSSHRPRLSCSAGAGGRGGRQQAGSISGSMWWAWVANEGRAGAGAASLQALLYPPTCQTRSQLASHASVVSWLANPLALSRLMVLQARRRARRGRAGQSGVRRSGHAVGKATDAHGTHQAQWYCTGEARWQVGWVPCSGWQVNAGRRAEAGRVAGHSAVQCMLSPRPSALPLLPTPHPTPAHPTPPTHSMVLLRAMDTRCSSSQRFITQYRPSCSSTGGRSSSTAREQHKGQ